MDGGLRPSQPDLITDKEDIGDRGNTDMMGEKGIISWSNDYGTQSEVVY